MAEVKASELRVGDSIRLLRVPTADLHDRANGEPDPDWIPTATVLEHLIATQPVVTITSIDDWGHPWFDARLTLAGETQYHSLAIMDEDSWAFVSTAGDG